MYCCPIEKPGCLPEPYHLPGYGGHIPSYRHRNGGTFGRLSRNSIEDPCVAQAPCPVLAPPMSKCCPPDPCCRNPVGCADIGCCDPACCPPPRIAPKRRKPPCEEFNCDPCKLMKCFPPQTRCVPCEPCGPPSGGGCGTSVTIGQESCASACPPEPACPPRKSCMKSEPKSFRCGPCPPADSDCDPRAHHLNRGPYCCPCKPEPDSMIYRCCESMSSSYAGHIPGFTFHSNGRTTGKATWGTKQYMNKCLYFNTFTKP